MMFGHMFGASVATVSLLEKPRFPENSNGLNVFGLRFAHEISDHSWVAIGKPWDLDLLFRM
jgi:hypothetical protein